jgi:SAM-dependent methyltransferase
MRADWDTRYSVADIRSLPVSDAAFDGVVVSKLFMHIEDWRTACREIIRVARPGSHIVHVMDRGLFANSVRNFFTQRADALGFTDRFVGVHSQSSAEITDFMASQECQLVRIDMPDIVWDFPVSYAEAIRGFEARLFSEFWRLPLNVYDQILAETIAWADAQPGGRDAVDHLKPWLAIEAFTTPAAS